MSEENLPIVISKEGCPRCEILKEWLDKKKVNYTERDIEDDKFVKELVADPKFIQTFCDSEGCIVNTPAVKHKGKYWFRELWTEDGLNEKKAKKLFLK